MRPAGLAGLIVVIGGVAGAAATLLPWATVVARLTMLGADDDRVVARLLGLPTTPSGWVALMCGVVAMVVGAMVVLDRPVPRTRSVLLGAAVGLGLAAATGLVAVPDVHRVAGREATRLLATTEGLPVGISLDLAVVTGIGPWIALVGAVAVIVGAATMRELER